MRVFITGGAGFIGSALVRHLISETEYAVLNLDKLTYTGVLASLAPVENNPRYRFVRGDICGERLGGRWLADFYHDVIAHLAAEGHVDLSNDEQGGFCQTNIVG